MDYLEFKDRLKTLVSFYKKQEDSMQAIISALDISGYPAMNYGHELTDSYVEMLSEAVGDKDNWISYWLWECEMGKRKMAWSDQNGRDYSIKSIRSLWKTIQLNKQ
jgi:hypothetical protein